MLVRTFYVDVDRYRARVLMLRAAAERVGHIHLLTVCPPKSDLSSPHLTIEPLSSERVRRPRIMGRLWRRMRGTDADIFHDTQSFMLPLFAELRRRGGGPFRLTSTFTASYTWWRTLQPEYPYWEPNYHLHRVQGHVEEWAMARVTQGMTVFGEGHRAPVAETYGLDVSQVHALPNCADDQVFVPRSRHPAVHGFGSRARVLLFSGNIFRYKGLYELLNAFARVRGRHPDARLLLVGPTHPAEEERVARTLSQLRLEDVVSMPGEQPHSAMPALLASCHAYVLPSYMEGSPRGIIEAMACARPVVATSLPGITVLDPERAFSQLVPRADEDGLTAALDEVLSASTSEIRRRGEAARARFLSHHTPAAAAVELAALYTRLSRVRTHRSSRSSCCAK